MNRKELIEAVAEKMGNTKKEATLAVESVIGSISDEMNRGGKVSLVGFGSFEVTKRNERKCRNPQSGAEMLVPAKMAPKFKPSKVLKESVAGLPVTE
ncbi:MAG: HU family DNA-binding protein [Candidatus Peribacteraceae bacterium]|nr:HU family DNA-binding protein [Candidatus Peribacteraceae bacterium]